MTYSYDNSGNLVQKVAGSDTTVYNYTIDNRLESIEDGSGSLTASYYYDPFGRRLWKEVGGVRTYYHYADEGLVAELDPNGDVIKTYGYKPDSVWGTDPLFMKVGENYYYYHNDHLGTPQKLTTSSGIVVWSARYDAFGAATLDIHAVENNLRFPGQYYDVETGYHYNWNRYYDPEIGRYITADPIGFEGGLNLYGYVDGNPVNAFDHNGLKLIPGNWRERTCVVKSVGFDGAAIVYAIHELSKNKAKDFANKLPKDCPDKDRKLVENAMRHCIASCRLAVAFNSDKAWEITECHEQNVFGSDTRTDRNNNRTGNKFGSGSPKPHPSQCETLCSKALGEGQLDLSGD